MAGTGSTQSSDTCDPAKSSGWVGTAVVREYKVGMERRGRGGMVCGLEKEVSLERSVS